MVKFQTVNAWYEMNVTGVLVGAMITLVTVIISQYYNKKYQMKKEKQNIILLIVQSNALLFSLIHQGSIDKESIDYVKLREELEKSNIIFILPKDIKISFTELIKIHFKGREYYRENKPFIHKYLKEIIKNLENYGVDAFGDK